MSTIIVPMDPIGLTDIAELFGLTRAGADKLVKREPDFPAYATITGRTRVWSTAEVVRWGKTHGRLCHEPDCRRRSFDEQVRSGRTVAVCDQHFIYSDSPQRFPVEPAHQEQQRGKR